MTSADHLLSQVVGGALNSAAAEMSAAITRTGRSPIFNEAHDFTTGIFDYRDDRARLVAQAPGCTLHLYAICDAVNAAIDAFRLDLRPGDVILASDPYGGGTHIPDQVVIMPVFVGGRPLFFPAARAHFADVGGPVAGGYNPRALDIWQDGVIVSPVKLYEQGRIRRDVFDMIVANSRTPHWIRGDLEAMRGACQLAAQRIEALVSRYGEQAVCGAIDNSIAYSERRVREEIARWRQGVFTAETFVDHDYQGATDIPIRCTATVTADGVQFDFSGSAPQVRGFVNSPIANTRSFVFTAIAACFDEDIPVNEGYMAPFGITAPERNIVNPGHPAPVGNCTCICGAEIAEVTLLALAQAAPERVGVNTHKLPLAYTSGRDEQGRNWVSLNFFGYTGGAGAAFGTDGWGLYPPLMTGVILPSIEMTERQYPLRLLRHEYVADQTGAGRWRGAPGLRTTIAFTAPSTTNAMLAGVRNPTRGFAGGGDGAPNALRLCPTDGQAIEIVDVGYRIDMPAGGRIEFLRGGGGGWGNALERPLDAIAEDIRNGYLTPAAALTDYEAVIDTDGRIDHQATSRRRGVPA
ncbi:MAG: hydantoinase B/oxoprolinase family protein [Pseudomonadota bacterium]|uniref:N-methylhydantoinase B n=1 Tax=hydrothermal vent metagenome TaxID=652676 RepID=A0A160TM94_9ZZZZ